MSLVENTAFSLLWFVVNEMAQSEFKPAEYELSIGGKNGVSAPAVTLENGKGTVHLSGKVDRVDLYRRDDQIFVRVVDYKTGKKTFSLEDLPYGLNMQMLLYLFAVCREAAVRYESKSAKPAGVLYLSTGSAPAMPIGEKKLKALRMNGLLVRDAGVLAAMEQDGKGTFIPASLKDGNIADNSSVASYQDFETIEMYTQALLGRMATRLLDGDIAAVPTGAEKELSCRYCAYRRICRRKDEDPFVNVEKRTAAEVFEYIEEVNGNGMD
jgi:ATP-dependent helicase/nuclease subunit B